MRSRGKATKLVFGADSAGNVMEYHSADGSTS